MEMVLVDRVPLAVELMSPDNERVVFLTLEDFYHTRVKEVRRSRPRCIPFLMKGADCMVAGIHNADESIQEGDLVWVRDQKHKRPLAIGWAMKDGNNLVKELKGKG